MSSTLNLTKNALGIYFPRGNRIKREMVVWREYVHWIYFPEWNRLSRESEADLPLSFYLHSLLSLIKISEPTSLKASFICYLWSGWHITIKRLRKVMQWITKAWHPWTKQIESLPSTNCRWPYDGLAGLNSDSNGVQASQPSSSVINLVAASRKCSTTASIKLASIVYGYRYSWLLASGFFSLSAKKKLTTILKDQLWVIVHVQTQSRPS